MRQKKIKVWGGEKEVEYTLTTFSALEQLKYADLQEAVTKEQKAIDALNKELEGRDATPEESAKLKAFNENSIKMLAEMVRKSLAKVHSEFAQEEANDKVLGIFDMSELTQIMGYLLGGDSVLPGFPEKQ